MKKFSQLDFEMWGRQVCTKHLEKGTPMNDSIVKIAEDNQLNRDQVNRVVEEANNQVYLQKFASADGDDKYIEFPVADAKEIAKTRSTLNTVQFAKEGSLDDYALSPKEHTSFNTRGTLRGVSHKTAGLEEPTDGEKNKMLFEAQGLQVQFEDKMNGLSNRFDEKVAEFKDLYEQVPGSGYNKIRSAEQFIGNTYDDGNGREAKMCKYILQDLPNEKLAGDDSLRWIKTNDKHPFFGMLKKAVDLGVEYTKSYDTGPDTTKIYEYGSRNEKTASYAAKTEEALWKFLVGAGVVSAGAIASHKLGYEKGKQVQAIKMSPMKGLPKTHNPRG